jgi:hypothetical protein
MKQITTASPRGKDSFRFAGLLAVAGGLVLSSTSWAKEPEAVDVKKLASHQKGIWTLLNAYSQDEDQQYPDLPGDANANFRVLFQKRLVDRESDFTLNQDGWFVKGKPDENIGTAPDFAKALEPGELSITYVAGYDGASPSQLPMMISGAGEATAWITGVSKVPPKTPFTGMVAVTFVGGTSTLLTPDKDGKIRQMKDGKMVDIFSAEYGTDPTKIRLPALPPLPPAPPVPAVPK